MINHPCHLRMWQQNSADDTLVLEQQGTFVSKLHWVGTTLRMLDLCWMKQLSRVGKECLLLPCHKWANQQDSQWQPMDLFCLNLVPLLDPCGWIQMAILPIVLTPWTQNQVFEALRYCWASDLCPLQLPLPHSFLYHAHHCWLSLLLKSKRPRNLISSHMTPNHKNTYNGLGTVPTTLYQTFRKELYIAWMLILQTWTGQDHPTYFEAVVHRSHFKHRYGHKSRSKCIVAGLHYLNSSSLLFNDHIIGVIGNQGMVRGRLLMFCKFCK